jgi:hypothetical protein
MKWIIYGLKDPRTDEIRYVGWTIKTPERRLANHIWWARKRRSSHVHRGILCLLAEDVTPAIEVLESGSGDKWRAAEREWIFRLRAVGFRLTNIADGGEGKPGAKLSAETRAKLSAAHSTPEARAAKSAFLRTRKWSDAQRAKMREIMRNRTPESYAALRASNIGRKDSPERTEKTASKLRGRKQTPEECQRKSQRQLGRKMSPEAIASGGASRTGLKRSGQALENIRNAAKQRDNAAIAEMNRGTKRTEETRAKLRDAWVKRKAASGIVE